MAAVFLRFLEDNLLLPEPCLSGTGARFDQARDRQDRFFVRAPSASDREYLLACFREAESWPATAPLFDERHNPLFLLGPSADGARAIIDLFRKVDPDSGALVHDFEDGTWDTRFLGTIYQDLSESARKKFALLQTPEFVEEFILDRTLEPAIAEVGFQNASLIDPACGSGHFLLGAFRRIFDRWQQAEPGINPRELARRALDQIAGIDVNPFAVAIARFRLLIAALRMSEAQRLVDAPAFPLHLAAGDSLLHGERLLATRGIQMPLVDADRLAHVYNTEDAEALRRILRKKYMVVVGNPPYITPKDSAENEAYRDRFGSCHRQYSLAVPFTERFFDLAARAGQDQPAGWVGLITSNSFMKREFGKKLIEQYIPRWDLTHVIDTSGAYIPGHGTPTVILIGRHRPPVSESIRTVMGIRGEPSVPEQPAQGRVWTAILNQIDQPSLQNEFVSVSDLPRTRLQTHPWSIGGGGASELKELLDETSEKRLSGTVAEIGFGAVTREDEAYRISEEVAARHRIPADHVRPLVAGEEIRNWIISDSVEAIWPYSASSLEPQPSEEVSRFLWRWRTQLLKRIAYGQTQLERGLAWFEYSMFFKERYRVPHSIAFAFVATHNHFLLDRGGKVFKQTAPIIKLLAGATEDDHFSLLGLLNSSTACFWLKQVLSDKGNGGVGGGIGDELWERRFEHDATKLSSFPLPSERPSAIAQMLDELARERAAASPRKVLKTSPNRITLNHVYQLSICTEHRLIALQEELDWQAYRLYGLLDTPLEADPAEVPEVSLGQRPFEIVLARKMAAGEVETKWFERHGSTPITEIPAHWPEPYRHLVEKRIRAIDENPSIALIEQPEYKRRWNREPWEEQERRALRNWLLDRLEDRRYWPDPPTPVSTARLADRLRQDEEFRQVAALYRGRDDFDWTELVSELALEEAVPFLAALRYTDSGLRKRAEWEETWRLQRLEDEGKFNGKDIPVPPRYASADFRKSSYWRLRGKLDVPKERFIHYPGLERGADPSPVIGWAGWNHLEQAQALGTAFQELREKEGWGAAQLTPVLAGLLELLPWIRQWYNDPDPTHGGLRLGDFFSGFLDEEARASGLTREDLVHWRPAVKAPRGRKARNLG